MKWKFVLTYYLGLNITQAYAFGVDLCFNSPSFPPAIVNCIPIDSSCRTSNLTLPQELSCRLQALALGVSGTAGATTIIGGRNTMHDDSAYLMAQLLGFTPWEAHQLLMYIHATDQSNYYPFDQNGNQMLTNAQITSCAATWGLTMPRECLVITPVMNGIAKFNATTGGMLLHWHARYSANGSAPPALSYPADYFFNTNKPYETLLTNMRDWVFHTRYDACAAGINRVNVTPDANAAACEKTQYILNSPVYDFSLGYAPNPTVYQTTLGPLLINQATSTTPNVVASDVTFGAYIYPHDVRYAKLGIFLHALGDRHSHHMCIDNSYYYRESTGNYTSVYDTDDCAQGNHFLWHVWEQGTDQSNANLNPIHQTMRPALHAVYQQLVAYRQSIGLTVNTVDEALLVNNLIAVLQVEDPSTRLNNMVTLMENYGVLPLPGHGSVAGLTIDQWLTLAGAPVL